MLCTDVFERALGPVLKVNPFPVQVTALQSGMAIHRDKFALVATKMKECRNDLCDVVEPLISD